MRSGLLEGGESVSEPANVLPQVKETGVVTFHAVLYIPEGRAHKATVCLMSLMKDINPLLRLGDCVLV